MSNILNAIYNISNLTNLHVDDFTDGNNRMLNVGEGLEIFVKNAFAGTFHETDKRARLLQFKEIFSYQGSKRTPPDLMLRGGDAVEVKKVESLNSELQLNSSFPKSKLSANSNLINRHCKICEVWKEKDIIYAIGNVPAKTKRLASIWFIYGSLYAADEAVYAGLKNTLTDRLENTPDMDFSPTNEIGRVNFVDPLRITNLRIRGMWLLKQPFKVFDYAHRYADTAAFQCITILPTSKYNSFDEESRTKLENLSTVQIFDEPIQDPNNPVNLIDCKVIRYER